MRERKSPLSLGRKAVRDAFRDLVSDGEYRIEEVRCVLKDHSRFIAPDSAHLYGIVATGAQKPLGFEISGMVEKPPKGTAPSNLHITGRYILQPEIFALLGRHQKGAGGEIQLTDAMIALADERGQPFHAVRFDGTIYDCGSKIGFLAANVAYALARDDLAPALKAEIRKLM